MASKTVNVGYIGVELYGSVISSLELLWLTHLSLPALHATTLPPFVLRLCSLSHAWKVIYFDPSDPTEGAKVPPTPFIGFRPISETRHIHVTTMSATATPPCLPWSSPTNPDSWQQPQAVTDQPFKRAFVKNPYQGSKDAGGRGMSPQSSAWRKDATGNSASRSRKGGRGGRGGRGERARETFRTGDAGETMPRASPARRGLRAGPPAGQQHTGTSMRFGRALGRPNVRLRV